MLVKACAVRGEQFGQLGVGVLGPVHEHARGGVVNRGAQVSPTRTDTVPGLQAGIADRLDTLGQRPVLLDPARSVAIDDLATAVSISPTSPAP